MDTPPSIPPQTGHQKTAAHSEGGEGGGGLRAAPRREEGGGVDGGRGEGRGVCRVSGFSFPLNCPTWLSVLSLNKHSHFLLSAHIGPPHTRANTQRRWAQATVQLHRACAKKTRVHTPTQYWRTMPSPGQCSSGGTKTSSIGNQKRDDFYTQSVIFRVFRDKKKATRVSDSMAEQ